MFGGRGIGGGSGAGGGMLRSVGRAVTRVGASGSAPQEPFSSSPHSSSASSSKSNSTSPSSRLARKPKSSSSTPLSLSSSVSFHNKNPLSGIPFWHSSPEIDDFDWVSVDGIEHDGTHGFSGHYVVGPVPSENEVEDAVCALQQVFGPASHVQLVRDKYYCKSNSEPDHATIPGLVNQVSSDGSEIDWVEPSLFPYNSKMLQANGSDRVYYAFHLLQIEPSVQRMVKSLSSDKAVWDAVLNNEVVRELRESVFADEEHVLQSPDETSNSDSLTTTVVMWIFDTAKAKFMEVIEKIAKIVNELFQPADHKRAADAEGHDPFNENLRISFMLSIMVLLVVVVSRAHSQGMA